MKMVINIILALSLLTLIFKTSKINLKNIFSEHFNTLKRENGSFWKREMILFYVLPMLITLQLVLGYKIYVNTEIINILITAFSIFVGFLINALLVIFSLENKTGNYKEIYQKKIQELLLEIYNNLMFMIILTSVIVMMSVIWIIFYKIVTPDGYFVKILSIIIDYLLISFCLHFPMIIKRLYAVGNPLNHEGKNKAL